MSDGEEIQYRGRGQSHAAGATDTVNEIQRLLNKYAGGRIPVLVNEHDTRLGLVNGELLRIYQNGFTGKNLIPLGVLMARPGCGASPKWERGCADYHLNSWAQPGWISVCQAIRASKMGETACEDCDRKRAKQAEKAKDVVAYMCVHGMVDFAMPIFVEEEVIAIIFTGQRVPKEGSLWNPEFEEERGLFSLDWAGKAGVKARKTTEARFKTAEKKYGFATNTLVDKLANDVADDEHVEITAEDVDKIRKTLRTAGNHLSNLAKATYSLEKSKAVAALRSMIARSLAKRGEDNIETVFATLSSVGKELSKRCKRICKYFGIEYMLVLNLREDPPQYRILIGCAPGEMPWDITTWVDVSEKEQFSSLLNAVTNLRRIEFGETSLWPLRKLPFFEWIATWLKGKAASHCVVARLDHPGSPHCILLAGKKDGLSLDDFRKQDKEDFEQIVRDIGMVLNMLLFVEELHATGEAQELFLEDVAHDIRNPIQNLLMKVERVKFSLEGELRHQMDKVGAQIRRLDQLSRRVWLLEQLRQKRLNLDDTKVVKVYQIIREAITMVNDLAEDKGIRFNVDRNMETWRGIKINRELFFHAMLNLIDNAVKYSHEGTEVKIDGRTLHPECKISVVNRGVEIKEKYREMIFRRGFRTPEANLHIRQGSGIGLCIVKAFADIYGHLDFNCSPVPGTSHFVTEFKLTVRGAIL